MGPLRRHAVPLLLVLAAACGNAGPQPDRVLSAAGTPTGDSQVTADPTTTSSTAPPTTVAPATTSTTKRPAPTTTVKAGQPLTTRGPVTPAPPIPGFSPPPPGVEPDGYGGYGGATRTSAYGVTIELTVYPRERYLGEPVQAGAQVSRPENVAITALKLDFGDGHVVEAAPLQGWHCGSTETGSTMAYYTHPASGHYRISAIVEILQCSPLVDIPGFPYPGGVKPTNPWLPTGPAGTVTASMDTIHRPDRRPPPVGPPPGP
jgi:hypothetical protein